MNVSADKNQFKNWLEALTWLFSQDSRYAFALNVAQSTTFEVGCSYEPRTLLKFVLVDQHDLRDDLLLSLEITHPDTLGVNHYWKHDFQLFEEHSYEESPRPGMHGLPFCEKNVSSLFADLKNGYRGTEKHFLQDKSILAVHLCIEAGCLGGLKTLNIWRFNWRPSGFINRLKWFFSSEEDRVGYFLAHAKPSHVREIDLSTIFKGVSTGVG